MIIIDREGDEVDLFRKYKIMINDTCYDKIEYNGRKIIKLDPGNYTIYLKVDWVKSNKIDFSISEGEVLEFSCGRNSHLDESKIVKEAARDGMIYGTTAAGAKSLFKALNSYELWIDKRKD